jgi:chemosensory pili system protein ChpE/L-lysine exporter family protein LysE/ArgO
VTPSDVLTILATAFALGLVFNAAPGPVFAATVRWGVRGGFRPALLVQLGSLAGDALWAMIGLAGIGLLSSVGALRMPIAVAGAAYLLWLGWDSWRASRQPLPLAASGGEARTAVRSGVLLSVTNPQNIGYWAAIGSAFGAIAPGEPPGSSLALFFAGFMLASIVWSLVCAAIVDRLMGRASPAWARATCRVCAVVFVGLALASLRDQWISRPSLVSRPAAAQHEE